MARQRPVVRLLRTNAFRLAALYLALFATSVSALLAFIYFSTADFVEKQTEATLDAALDLASVVAAQAPLAVLAAKQAILQAAELSLSAGLDHERRAFFQLFETDDQTEGMTAFGEKRPASWTGS